MVQRFFDTDNTAGWWLTSNESKHKYWESSVDIAVAEQRVLMHSTNACGEKLPLFVSFGSLFSLSFLFYNENTIKSNIVNKLYYNFITKPP